MPPLVSAGIETLRRSNFSGKDFLSRLRKGRHSPSPGAMNLNIFSGGCYLSFEQICCDVAHALKKSLSSKVSLFYLFVHFLSNSAFKMNEINENAVKFIQVKGSDQRAIRINKYFNAGKFECLNSLLQKLKLDHDGFRRHLKWQTIGVMNRKCQQL